MPRNPTWERDELLLALETYLRNGSTSLEPTNPEILALSRLLCALPLHPEIERAGSFRNPQGVAMKLANFVHLDPGNPGQGLNSTGAGDRAVWKEFGERYEELKLLTDAIRNLPFASPDLTAADFDSDDESFLEGRLLERTHKARERNRSLVKKKLRAVRLETGRLACEVCRFDFATAYGLLGEGFAECHHRLPLNASGPRQTRLRDLAVVCANCHRMIHRSRPLLTVEGLSELLRTSS